MKRYNLGGTSGFAQVWGDRSLRLLLPLIAGFVLVLLAAAVAVLLSLQAQQASAWFRHSVGVQSLLNQIQISATDAETGQRGYLLTGRLSYLEPYEAARRELTAEFNALASETADNAAHRASVAKLRQLLDTKLGELQETIDLRSSGRAEEALAIVNGNRGSDLMRSIRATIADMRQQEARVLQQRSDRVIWLDGVGRGVLLGSVVIVAAFGLFAVADARRRILELQTSNQKLERETFERASAEKQLRQLQKMEAIGQLTGGIAHDFNNMLALIIGSLDIARRRLGRGEPDAAIQAIDNAAEGANRAAVLTARLLAFSRQQPLEPAVLDVNRLVGGMSELLRRTIGETIRVETVLAGGLWPVYADPTQLETALVNLTVNARDAMSSGGSLTIETGNTELDDRYAAAHSEVTPGQYVMVSVSDTGIGMPPVVIERAFEPFYTTKGPGKGTGLGLSQIYGFVKQSAGHVKIYSEPGHGTTVKIYLPRYIGPAEPKVADERPQSLPLGSADKIILVVEDEVRVRDMTVASLRELGYTVVHATSGEEALKKLDAYPNVTLLLTDIVLPEMNGRQIADIATERAPHLKVLFTTGYTRNAIIHNGVVDPGVNFLPKPFTLSQLAAKVDQALR